MKHPLKVFKDLPNYYPQTNAAFSPDEQLIFTGTSVEKDGASGGLLCFFSRKKLELESRVGISSTLSVVRCAWHPKLNQVRLSCIFGHYWHFHGCHSWSCYLTIFSPVVGSFIRVSYIFRHETAPSHTKFYN